MTLIPLLAHGSLGNWDELIFLGVVVIFLGLMIFSWFRSRSIEFVDDEVTAADKLKNDERPDGQPERFQLD